jgi:hypothetical protein
VPLGGLRVFLCHASEDEPTVRHLYERLWADGFAPWMAEENLHPGQEWRVQIARAVRQSEAVLVCLSPHSVGKAGYLNKEITIALDVADEQPEDTIFLIPVRLEECYVPDRLSRWQWVNLFKARGYERLRRALQVRAEGSTRRVALAGGAKPDVPSHIPPPGAPVQDEWFLLDRDLRQTLLQCSDYTGSDATLRALFRHPWLAHWHDGLPEAPTLQARVDLLLAYLVQKRTPRGMAAIPVMLEVLAERYDPNDACHGHLRSLAHRYTTLASTSPAP